MTSKFIYRAADITDYPDFTGRAYCLNNWANMDELNNDIGSIERMASYKFNETYQGYSMPG